MSTNTPWPEGVIARYPTRGGATVDVTPRPKYRVPDAHTGECRGCGKLAYSERSLDTWALRHADTCRTTPRPDRA
ncbi:hypothetical protein EYS09_24795 [Streptomyces kasugaensis]|uniref:Mobile element transfer n=1 Tax=Streptomyces kasugaensis TaxID=1946 RepID=A0A4Q9HQ23_STRKA|nr:hypothetical protein [Streptomyces kasugaensis]TBO57024.1 hypothetical protein EYS09_24795 [Streptomyces kasugaensis]